MLELISVTLVSAAGWLISLSSPHSAARRHLILTSALGACLLLPMALIVRAGTSSTLLTFETKVRRNTIAPIRTPPSASVIAQRASLIDHASASEAAARTPHAEDVTARNDKETFRSLPTISDFSATAIGRPEQISPQNPTALPRRTWQTSAARWGRTVYAVVAATLLIRLLFGLASVLRLKRLAGAIDSFANGIPVLEADIAIPLAIGFGKPVIVLPRGFAATVTPNELRDVLAHEAEHLRRRDHWTILLQRLIATAYWPVVTVHLLNRALDRAREELCDNAAIRERDPASYGHTLLVVAQQVGVRNESLSQWATSVIGQGELERREAGLLDRRRDRRTRISRSVRWTTTATLLLLCGLAGTTRVVAVADGTQQSKSTPAEPAKAPAAPKAMLEWTGIPKVSLDNPTLHRGIVLGPDGHPLPGASIYAASTIELLELSKADKVSVKDLGPVRAVTDAQGRFEFDAQDLSWVTPAGVRKRWETLLVAARDGVVSGWIETYGDDRSFRSHWNPFPGKDVAIRTRPPVTLAGAFSLEGGTPLADARVRLTALFAPFEYDLDRHIPREEKKEIGLFSGINYAERLHRPWLLPGLKTETTTDNDGRFELPNLPEGFIAELEVAHPQAVTTELRAAVRRIEPVYRKSFGGGEEATPTLYGSDFKIELEKGVILRGEVTSDGFASKTKAAGISAALANHNSPDGMTGKRFKTDSEGRFLVTGLAKNLEGYELAFAGSFAAPFRSARQRAVFGAVARVELAVAVPYRLKLTDRDGNPIDRTVFSVGVQQTPGTIYRDIKATFNDAERVAPGIYEGIVPIGPGAVLVKRGKKTDRPAAVNPKAFFEPGRTDWTPEEERYAYGDAWHIATPGVSTTDMLGANRNPLQDQLELAAAVFTKASKVQGVLELTAVVDSDPPVEFTLVDLAGKPVENVRVDRLSMQYDADKLPSSISMYGLHPERAEPLQFFQDQRELIATVSAKWTAEPVRVVLQPAATLTGRFVDKAGQPKFDFGIRILGPGVMPDTFVAGRRLNITDKPGERSGEFRQVLTPGFDVRGEFVRYNFDSLEWKTRPALGPAFGPVLPKPGETIDLGNIKSP